MAAGLSSASVVVVSRGRPEPLRRCLTALRQLDHPEFEVVVVADAAGLWAVADMGLSALVKTERCDEANVSLARNRGIALAAGEVVAFIDDDAVPEPTWLSRLCAVFSDDRVAAAGGVVIGRNGLSVQWGPAWCDALGNRHPLEAETRTVSLHEGAPGAAVRTEGTNMAMRRALLAQMGGFDPAYRFYLDDTDLNMRQAEAGQITAIVPLAQVHHGFAAGPHRRADRVPVTLFEIGASAEVFLRRHAPPGAAGPRLASLRAEQRRRLLQHMVAGGIEPADVARLLGTFDAGVAEGRRRPLIVPPPIGAPEAAFLPLPGTGPRPPRLVAGWWWQGPALRRRARRWADEGALVTMIRLSPTTLWHRARFHPDGYWEQTGGLFGRSRRDGPLLHRAGFRARLADELERIGRIRPVDTVPQ